MKDKAATIVKLLRKKYPEARYELQFETPLQLLVGTILAAQCTDERVNQVTPALFARFADARAFADGPVQEIEKLIRTIPFCRKKAAAIQQCCREIVEKHGGQVPRSIDELVPLPRIGRKTANIVLNQAYGIPSGIIVDTHVARVSRRLGLTTREDADEIEQDLLAQVPKPDWIHFGAAMVLHGRYTCTSKDPKCSDCVLNEICPRIGVEPKPGKCSR